MRHNNNKTCLRNGWPVHLASLDILFGIVDDCIETSSFLFHCTEPKCLMCWLDERYDSDDLYWYDIVHCGRYVDVHITIRHLSSNVKDIIFDEIHLTCKRNDF